MKTSVGSPGRFWSLVLGVLSLMLGLKILYTGNIKNTISLGNDRYVVGGVIVAFGIYALITYFVTRARRRADGGTTVGYKQADGDDVEARSSSPGQRQE